MKETDRSSEEERRGFKEGLILLPYLHIHQKCMIGRNQTCRFHKSASRRVLDNRYDCARQTLHEEEGENSRGDG